jgi:hypothetical protein
VDEDASSLVPQYNGHAQRAGGLWDSNKKLGACGARCMIFYSCFIQ